MKTASWCVAFAAWAVSGVAMADDESEEREDPWAYDRTKAAERKDREEEDSASERSFGVSGDVVISAERLLGYSRTGRRTDMPSPAKDITDSVDRVHLFLGAEQDVQGFSAPRVAFDFFLSDGLSLGVALGYSSLGGDSHGQQFLGSLRVGYAWMFGDVVGLWPRAGGTYQYQKFTGGKALVIAGAVELPVVFVTSESSLITLGPTVDATIFGDFNATGPEEGRRFSQDEIGISAGLALTF